MQIGSSIYPHIHYICVLFAKYSSMLYSFRICLPISAAIELVLSSFSTSVSSFGMLPVKWMQCVSFLQSPNGSSNGFDGRSETANTTADDTNLRSIRLESGGRGAAGPDVVPRSCTARGTAADTTDRRRTTSSPRAAAPKTRSQVFRLRPRPAWRPDIAVCGAC